MRITMTLLLVSSCSDGAIFHDCEPNHGIAGVEIAQTYFPSNVINRVDFFCVDQFHEYPKEWRIDCITDFQGNNNGYRAKYRGKTHLADRCFVHESFHSMIWEQTGETCFSHSSDCGWDKILIDEVTKGLPK